MGLRITTWNVNGIRNPFGYQPWRDKKTFQAMFDILEADIVIMQETKIQQKDLRDDMVLVPGWDVYFSLPKHKKGYSGVAIYVRNSACAPIRAEEGITGILGPPNSSTSFRDLPEEQQIGGYPDANQLARCPLDEATLDSEGRCVILEFPAFVLIGVYSPANRDETRDSFRLGFLNALDARVRNLVAGGKRVLLAGDLNIIREEIDTANAEEQLRKYGMAGQDYVATPARRILNQLLLDGKVIGDRDEGREESVLWDICRGFHPGRKGMFTCWETKINARPGNFGSRIDYVLCSRDWKDWFCDSNIQEGLLGSDHCPVYATIKDMVDVNGAAVHIRDIVNPHGMFNSGIRQREWNPKDLLPTSARLIPEFDRRRNIRDMFAKKPSLPICGGSTGTSVSHAEQSLESSAEGCLETECPASASKKKAEQMLETGMSNTSTTLPELEMAASMNNGKTLSNDDHHTSMAESASIDCSSLAAPISASITAGPTSPQKANGKRTTDPTTLRALKRSKQGSSNAVPITGNKSQPAKGQSSLRGFFKSKTTPTKTVPPNPSPPGDNSQESLNASLSTESTITTSMSRSEDSRDPPLPGTASPSRTTRTHDNNHELESPGTPFRLEDQQDVIDPIAAKESWSRLLSKRVLPRCEHNEPCVSYLTKKPGMNCGRSFYICPRPLGPSGQKEKGTQWRCGTFIWSSDWTSET